MDGNLYAKQYFDAFNTERIAQGAYGLDQNDPDTGALGFDYGLVGEPRTYGADLTYRF